MNLSKEQLNKHYTWVYVNDVREYALVSMPLRSLSHPWDMSSLGFEPIGIVSNTTEIKFLGLHGDPITVTGIEAINICISQNKPYTRKVVEINAGSLWDTVDELYEGDIMKFSFKKKKKGLVSIYYTHPLEDILEEIENYECKNDSGMLFPPYYAAIYKNIKGEYHVRITKIEDLISLPESFSGGYSFIGIASERTTMGFDYPNPTEPGMVIQKSMCIGNSAIIKELLEGRKKDIVIDSLNQDTLWSSTNDLVEHIDRHEKYKKEDKTMKTKLAVYRNFRGAFIVAPISECEEAGVTLFDDFSFMGYVRPTTEAEVVLMNRNEFGPLRRNREYTVGPDELQSKMDNEDFLNIQYIDCFNLDIPDDKPAAKYRQLALYNSSGIYSIPPRTRKDFIEQAERYESHLERIWRQSQEEKTSIKELLNINSDVIDYCTNDVKGAMDMMANCFNNEDDDSEDAINPSYYGPKGMQPDDYSRAHNMSNMLHQTLKYMTRAGKKNPDKHIEDLDKALNCLRKEREFVLKEQEKGEEE